MNRRDVLQSSLLGAGALAVPFFNGAAGCSHLARNAKELNGGRMPNILWICPDMQRFDTIDPLPERKCMW